MALRPRSKLGAHGVEHFDAKSSHRSAADDAPSRPDVVDHVAGASSKPHRFIARALPQAIRRLVARWAIG